MRLDRFQQEAKNRTTLLDTGGRYGPKPLAPVLPLVASGSLGHAPVYRHEANCLFCQVVRRVHVGFGDETEIAIRVVSKAFGQIARFPGRGQMVQSSSDESVPLPGQHQAKTLVRRVV